MLNIGSINNMERMLLLATKKHLGHKDKGGKPYIFHCIRTVANLDHYDEDLICIALGCDLIRHTDITAQFLIDHQYSERVVNAIELLTKKDGQNYKEFVEGIKSNIDCVNVMLAKLEDNLDLTRMNTITEYDSNRYKRYSSLKIELKMFKYRPNITLPI